MRAENKLHFSPSCIFDELRFEDKGKLIACFRDRVYGFYLDPASLLNEKKFGFASGLLCVAIIDSLARIEYPMKAVGNRIQKWLKNNIKEFDQRDFARRFYEDFRCGLVHEGRIKNPGEFSYESDKIISSEDEITRINPDKLLKEIERTFEQYLTTLWRDPSVFKQFKDALKKDFEEEVNREKKHIM